MLFMGTKKIDWENQITNMLNITQKLCCLGHLKAVNESTVRRLMKKFETTGLMADTKTPIRSRASRYDQNIIRR